jgi:uncharacterized membrane protein
MSAFFSTVVRFFLTGIATLLPLVVTVFVVGWIVRLADAYIGPSSSFGAFLITIFGPKQYPGYVAGYLVVVLLIILLGFLVTRATVARVHKAVDGTFARIPLFGKIYTAVGQVVSLLGQKQEAGLDRFGGIVQIGIGGIKMLALLTSSEPYVLKDGKEYLLVFIPNAPVPATGFNMLVPAENVEHLDMPVEDLAKLLMSLGLLAPQVLRGPLSRFTLKTREDEREAS